MKPDWTDAMAPSIPEIEGIAERAYEALPEEFRALTRGVVIRVVDFPEEDVLRELDAETEFDLLGLFQGIGLAQDGAVRQSGQMLGDPGGGADAEEEEA